MTKKIMEKKVSLKQLVFIAFILFLIGGFSIGFAVGGKTVHNNWLEYVELEQERIDRECTCIGSMPDLEENKWYLGIQ